MSVVKFAFVCDRCGHRNEEYSAAPHCTECARDLCPDCATGYDEETGHAICLDCAADEVFA